MQGAFSSSCFCCILFQATSIPGRKEAMEMALKICLGVQKKRNAARISVILPWEGQVSISILEADLLEMKPLKHSPQYRWASNPSILQTI
jgi:hypothetical protein